MNIQFNYENLHLYLLSLHTTLLVMGVYFILSPMDTINLEYIHFIIVYSLLGVICCVLAWRKINIIINNAKSIQSDGLYHPLFDDSKIHQILGERLQVINNLIIALLIIGLIVGFIVSIW